MKALKSFLPVLIVWSLGCSNHYRIMDMDDASFVAESYSQVLGGISAASQSSEIERFKQLASHPEAGIYYADNLGPYGSVLSIASFNDFGFLGQANLTPNMLSEVRIFFVDAFTTQGRQAGLLIAYKTSESTSFEVKAFVSTQTSEIADGEFLAVLGSGGQHRFTLRTMYVDEDDELEAIIRLQVYQLDQLGYESYVGQFSTLVWYQN